MGLAITKPPPEARARRRDDSQYSWSDSCIRFAQPSSSPFRYIPHHHQVWFSLDRQGWWARSKVARYSHIPHVFPKPEDVFPTSAEFSKILGNSGNMVILQEVVLKYMIIQVGWVKVDIYFHGETSVNMNTGVESWDLGFKHPEADTMLLSAYAMLRAKKYSAAVVIGHVCMYKRHMFPIISKGICWGNASTIMN